MPRPEVAPDDERDAPDDVSRETRSIRRELGGGAARAVVAVLEEGAIFGRYRVLRCLGEGGMGSVFLAIDTRLDRRVALKVTRPGADAGARERFAREARAIAALRHPNIVAIFDVGEVSGLPFLAMEYVDGPTLRALVGDGSVSLERRVALLTDVARALAAAHRAGIVHRDIKPENVAVDREGRAIVLDFGIALRTAGALAEAPTQQPETTLTGPGGTVGTPAYMAPEQLRGADVDARADQFAWGVLAFELLAGEHPFAPGRGTALIAAILENEPPLLGATAAEVPASIEAAVARALRKHPNERFASFDALLADLARPAPAPTLGRARWRRLGLGALGAALLFGVAALGVARLRPRALAAADAAAVAAAPPIAPSSAAVPIDALSVSAGVTAEAAAAYRAGLRHLEDDDWDAAATSFDRAAAIEPSFGAAQVQRVVVESDPVDRDMAALRGIYNLAFGLRAQLAPRDAALLDAYEPVVAREPQDNLEYRRRITAAAEKFPGDVQLQVLAASEIGDSSRAIAAFDRILALDPRCASAWQLRSRHLAMLGRFDEALASFDGCLAVSPASQCLEERVAFWAERGECAKMTADARTWVAKSAGDPYAYYLLANALARDDAPDEAVLEALRLRHAKLTGDQLALARGLELAKLDVLRGRFDRAEEKARALLREVESSANARPHGAASALLAAILVETGRVDEADRLATGFLARYGAWNHPGETDDGVPEMLAVRERAGTIGREEATARADAWFGDKRRSTYILSLPYLWVWAYGARATTRADAEAALAKQDLPYPAAQAYLPVIPLRAAYGRTLLLAGRDAALVELREAASSCTALDAPFAGTEARLWLARALEAGGHRAEACSSYASVLVRWGAAAASTTAKAAQRESARLSCPR